MKACDHCQEQSAQIQITEAGDDGVQTLALCAACAKHDPSACLTSVTGGITPSELPIPLVFEPTKDYGFLRQKGLGSPNADDIYVPVSIVSRFELKKGDSVSGRTRAPRKGERYFCLVSIDAVQH